MMKKLRRFVPLFALLVFLSGCDQDPTPVEVQVILPPPDEPAFTVGDGICSGAAGENVGNSPQDCAPPTCPDGSCAADESHESCPADCEAPPDPSPVVVIAAGSCVGLVSALQCVDESTFTLDGAAVPGAHIEWDVVFNATGLHVGGSTGQPAERFQLNGLPAGVYSVTLRAVATDEERDDTILNATVIDP